MRALSDDAPGVEERDLVGEQDARAAVRDDDACAAVRRLLEGREDLPFDRGVDGTRRIVEHDEPGASREHARERHALTLTAREPRSALAERSVLPLRQRRNEPLGVRDTERLINSPRIHTGAPQRDVLTRRLVEHERLLRREGHPLLACHGMRGGHAVIEHAARIGRRQPRDDLSERRLAGTRRPDDGEGSARGHAQRHVGQRCAPLLKALGHVGTVLRLAPSISPHRRPRVVTERHVLDLDADRPTG